jgi:hypothetical protein
MPLMALLALLAAAPASASSVKPAPCIHVSSTTAGSDPTSLDDLRACQDRARAEVVNAAASKGTPLTDAQLDKIDDIQRAEARKFLSRSQLVTTGGAAPAASQDSAGAASPAQSSGKLGGATAADLSRVDKKSAASIAGLQARMQAAAGDGKNGVTPAMADDVRATLMQSQGSISPDMAALLDGVQKDGGKLTSGTMKMLQGAGQSAKASGLDLNIDQTTEKQLLETDFNKEKPADEQQAPGGM